jgi:NAD dependent epimerase/dehydratase family enzyme
MALGRPSWLPVPPVAIRLLLGEVADVATNGQWVVPKRLTEAGFEFRFPRLHEALSRIFAL